MKNNTVIGVEMQSVYPFALKLKNTSLLT